MNRGHHRVPAAAAWLCLLPTLHGCGPTVESYVDDSEARRDVLGRCATLEIDPRTDERCAMATEAEVIAAKQAVERVFSK